MKTRLLICLALATCAFPALAHDPSAHSRKPAATPVECAAFASKDAASLDLKDPAVKAAHDKCEAARKAARTAADAQAKDDHDH